MNYDSTLFRKYVDHVLHWEGGQSNDARDSAASCAPYAGAIHTNKGITYCTFKQYAASLGFNNSYERFLQLSDQDAAKFIYQFYQAVQGFQFPDYLALALTEAAWLSGVSRASKTLQDALNDLGAELSVDGVIGPLTLTAAREADQNALYEQFWNVRLEWLNHLGQDPEYDQWLDGWLNRSQEFLYAFPANGDTTGKIGFGLSIALLGLAIYLVSTMPKARRA